MGSGVGVVGVVVGFVVGDELMFVSTVGCGVVVTSDCFGCSVFDFGMKKTADAVPMRIKNITIPAIKIGSFSLGLLETGPDGGIGVCS